MLICVARLQHMGAATGRLAADVVFICAQLARQGKQAAVESTLVVMTMMKTDNRYCAYKVPARATEDPGPAVVSELSKWPSQQTRVSHNSTENSEISQDDVKWLDICHSLPTPARIAYDHPFPLWLFLIT